jgi:hypothetical protein
MTVLICDHVLSCSSEIILILLLPALLCFGEFHGNFKAHAFRGLDLHEHFGKMVCIFQIFKINISHFSLGYLL